MSFSKPERHQNKNNQTNNNTRCAGMSQQIVHIYSAFFALKNIREWTNILIEPRHTNWAFKWLSRNTLNVHISAYYHKLWAAQRTLLANLLMKFFVKTWAANAVSWKYPLLSSIKAWERSDPSKAWCISYFNVSYYDGQSLKQNFYYVTVRNVRIPSPRICKTNKDSFAFSCNETLSWSCWIIHGKLLCSEKNATLLDGIVATIRRVEANKKFVGSTEFVKPSFAFSVQDFTTFC